MSSARFHDSVVLRYQHLPCGGRGLLLNLLLVPMLWLELLIPKRLAAIALDRVIL